jgi:hypothetical protein
METVINPVSEREWHLTLHALLDGAYNDLVERLGSVDEIVRVVLRDSRQHSMSRANFELALRGIVSSWDPNESKIEAWTLRLFDLIEAFAPEIAVTKILGQFERTGEWPVALVANKTGMASSEAVQIRALKVLESFFPAAMHDHRAATYTSYIALLEQRLDSPFGPYCLRRLIEVYALDVTAQPASRANKDLQGPKRDGYEELHRQIVSRPVGTIFELLRFVISSNSPLRSDVLLSLLGASLRADAIADLGDQLAILGASLVPVDQTISLQTPFELIPVQVNSTSILCLKKLRSWAFAARSTPDEIREMFV